MPATGGHSEACCNIPPVVAQGYKENGSYEELDGMKTYVTGPSEASKGVVVIFDIFGFFPQTLQGADILATSDASHKYKVFIPDWFNGEPCPIEWYPPDTKEKQENLGAFFKKNSPPSVAKKLPDLVKALEAKNPSIKSWGILGYCWGGKVVSLVASGGDNPFSIGAEVHPAMIDPNDAARIKIPLIMLASGDEDAEAVQKFEKTLSVPKHVEIFKDQIHGWMAARADLSQDRVKEEYTRGYRTLVEFFGNNWK